MRLMQKVFAGLVFLLPTVAHAEWHAGFRAAVCGSAEDLSGVVGKESWKPIISAVNKAASGDPSTVTTVWVNDEGKLMVTATQIVAKSVVACIVAYGEDVSTISDDKE